MLAKSKASFNASTLVLMGGKYIINSEKIYTTFQEERFIFGV
jgi:hypothetical protein